MKYLSESTKEKLNNELQKKLLDSTKEHIIYYLLTNDSFLSSIVDFLNPNVFQPKYRGIVTKAINFYKKYNSPVKDNAEEIFTDIKELQLVKNLLNIKPKNKDLLLDIVLNIYRRYLINEAIELTKAKQEELEQADINRDPSETLDENKKVINDILSMWNDILISSTKHADVGIEIFDPQDITKEIAQLEKERTTRIYLGYPLLDNIFTGVYRGEILNIFAPTGVGKTMLLINFMTNILLTGRNVLYLTLELNRISILKRFLQLFAKFHMSKDELTSTYISKMLVSYSEKYNDSIGRGRIVYKSPNTFSVQDLRILCAKLETKGFVPDAIVIDYADYIKPARFYETKRHSIEDVYMDLQTLADDLNVAILTASQTGRSASRSKVVSAEDSFEGYVKSQISDKILGVNEIDYETASNINVLRGFVNDYIILKGHIAKNRSNSGKGRILMLQDKITTRVYVIGYLFEGNNGLQVSLTGQDVITQPIPLAKLPTFEPFGKRTLMVDGFGVDVLIPELNKGMEKELNNIRLLRPEGFVKQFRKDKTIFKGE